MFKCTELIEETDMQQGRFLVYTGILTWSGQFSVGKIHTIDGGMT